MYHVPISSNISLINLFLYVNFAVNTILFAHDPGSINICNTASNQSSLYGKLFFGIIDVKKIQFKAHLSLLNDWWYHHKQPSDHRAFLLMSLNPLAPAFLPHNQSPSDSPMSLCNSTAMSLPVFQIICGKHPSIIPSHAPPLRKPITDDTFILLLIQPMNPFKQDAATFQPPPGYLSLLHSTLQHQAQCLQAIRETIQQFHQHLKAEQLDRRILQTIVLQLPNDFALLRCSLFWLELFPSVILP